MQPHTSQFGIEESDHSSKMWGIRAAEGLMRWILSSLVPSEAVSLNQNI